MAEEQGCCVTQCGGEITLGELEEIRGSVEEFWRLSRRELAETIWEHLGWYTASGSNKVDACVKLLEELESWGELRLAPKGAQGERSKGGGCDVYEGSAGSQGDVGVKLKELGLVWLEVVSKKEFMGLWKGYVSRYDYLGCKQRFENDLRYFIQSPRGVWGCLLMAGAAKSMGGRDRWNGWTEGQRLRNLGWLTNNRRFLIFPWVKLRNLASDVLGQLVGRIRAEWYARWSYSPVLMESFVDPRYFDGSCYKAANWEYLGMSMGEGLVGPGKSYRRSPKKISVKPLVRDFREGLCSDGLAGEVQP